MIAATFSRDSRLILPPGYFMETIDIVPGTPRLLVRYGSPAGERYMELEDWTGCLGAMFFGYYPVKGNLSPQVAVRSMYEGMLGDALLAFLVQAAPHLGSAEDWDVRFCLSGSDALSAAVRLARAVTGHWAVIVEEHAYHGWHDWFIATRPPHHGLRHEDMPTFSWQEPGRLVNLARQALTGDVEVPAALIVEYPLDGWNEEHVVALREFKRLLGDATLLIVDEVVTGFRFRPGLITGRHALPADIICLGKLLGHGLPLSALIGRKDYMAWFERTDPVFVSSTYAGFPAALKRGLEVVEVFSNFGPELWAEVEGQGASLLAAPLTRGTPERLILDVPPNVRGFLTVQAIERLRLLVARPLLPSPVLEGHERLVDFLHEMAGQVENVDASWAPVTLFSQR